MFNVAAHRPALLHFQRAGNQSVGADHLRVCLGVMRVDAFTMTTGTVAVTESEAVTLASF